MPKVEVLEWKTIECSQERIDACSYRYQEETEESPNPATREMVEVLVDAGRDNTLNMLKVYYRTLHDEEPSNEHMVRIVLEAMYDHMSRLERKAFMENKDRGDAREQFWPQAERLLNGAPFDG